MRLKIEEKTKQYTIALTISGLIILGAYVLIHYFPAIWAFMDKLFGVLMPFIFGFSIAFIFTPLMKRIENQLLGKTRLSFKAKRIIAAFMTIIIIILLIVAFFAALLPSLIESVVTFTSQLPDYMDTAQVFIEDFLLHYQVDQAVMNQIIEWGEGFLTSTMDTLLSYFPKILSTSLLITTRIFNFLIGLIIALYILLDRERFSLQFKKVTYALLSRKHADEVVEFSRLSSHIFNKFIIGKAIDSFIIGVLCYICMLIIGWPYALLISVIVGITNMIPVFGPFIGAVPGAVILFLVNPIDALGFLLFILILQQFDGNILGPKILGDSLGLPSLWVMFAIIVGGGFFGIVGMFIGVPLFTVVYTYVKRITEDRLAKKALVIEQMEEIK